MQILVETQKYLTCLGVLSKIYETDELLLYPNNKKMLRGIITSQLSTFVGVIFFISWTQGQSHVIALIYSPVYKRAEWLAFPSIRIFLK